MAGSTICVALGQPDRARPLHPHLVPVAGVGDEHAGASVIPTGERVLDITHRHTPARRFGVGATATDRRSCRIESANNPSKQD
jgi:hypothetical protein